MRNPHADKETKLRTRHGTKDWLKIGKGICLGYVLSPCSFNLYAAYITCQLCPTLCSLMDCSLTGSSVGESLQPFPSHWDLPNPGIKPRSPTLQADSLPRELSRKSTTLATWCNETMRWKRSWFWERLRAGGEGTNRGWDGWMASPTQWTWVWASSGRWWRTGKPGVLQFMGSQQVGHDLVTDWWWWYASLKKI